MAAMGGVLAIDLGTKRTGFAFADALRILSQPLDVAHVPGEGPQLLAHVAGLLEERDVSTFLLGLPVSPGGGEGERATATRAFAARLGARFPGVEVILYDETLTTKEAEDLLREAGHHGADRKARRDSWSALVLLRDWMESGEPR